MGDGRRGGRGREVRKERPVLHTVSTTSEGSEQGLTGGKAETPLVAARGQVSGSLPPASHKDKKDNRGGVGNKTTGS